MPPAPINRAGRVAVEPDLSLPGHPEVLAFGDMVRVRDACAGAPQVLPGMDHLADRASLLLDRIPEPRAGAAAMGIQLLHPRAWRASHHRGSGHRDHRLAGVKLDRSSGQRVDLLEIQRRVDRRQPASLTVADHVHPAAAVRDRAVDDFR
jgi:hypothetical protein